MKQLLIFIGIICVLTIEARNVQEPEADSTNDDSEENALLKHIKEHASSQMRHKRRSRQSHYDYWNPYQYDNFRRESDRRQDDMLAQIFRQLEELSAYVKRPPPPPIYIPYPVIYSVPQYRPCNCKPSKTNVTFPDRLPEMEDENQNWGPVPEDAPEEGFDNDDDGTRPIILKPIGTNRPSQANQPPLEHGSSQAGIDTTTRASVKMPGMCQAAVLFCCNLEQQQKCFEKYGCQKSYRSGQACRLEVIKRVIADFTEAYSPNNLS
ncbi:uncharacterized protein LOC119840424 [Zerene cesonia]|uniref:uncharacterized protein LOC119840424 n=1 Tax=Zerene cesonia TaxID=33412 RepID=UPI0018E55367|nr:uncharacterized protein LOC119840424 [Zerene cesonia]